MQPESADVTLPNPGPPQNRQALLAPTTYMIIINDATVFLDSKADDYLFLESTYISSIRNLFKLQCEFQSSADPHQTENLGKMLLQRGLITYDQDFGKVFYPPNNTHYITEFGQPLFTTHLNLPIRHTILLFWSLLITIILTTFFPLASIIHRLERRKLINANALPTLNIDSIFATYSYISPLLFTKKDKCFFKSLLLIEFMSFFNIYPTWQFGVRLDPFLAHCWVIYNDHLYDDHIENICEYSVIMEI